MKPRARFLLLVFLFAAPVAAALLVYFAYPEWRPGGRTNYGTLVEPLRPVELALAGEDGAPAAPDALRRRWSLVYVAGEPCGDACRERLLLTRQVRLALNQNRSRVQRVYLAADPASLAAAKAQLSAEHPDLVFLAAPGAAGLFQPEDAHALYLLDPLGNWLMTYTGTIEPRGLHKDLKRLLRTSQIG